MALPRFFVDTDIHVDASVLLPEKTAHHLSKVLRLKIGEAVVIFNGTGGEFHCVITSIGKRDVTLTAQSFDPVNRDASLPIHLGMSVIKKDAMDAVLARAAEMGIRSITPLITDRCTVAKKVIRNRQTHWQQVLIAACEQCGLNIIPALNAATPLDDWLAASAGNIKVIASPGNKDNTPDFREAESVDLLVGPEGGFTDDEVSAAIERGFKTMTLGQRVLRAETAPTALAAVIQQQWSARQG